MTHSSPNILRCAPFAFAVLLALPGCGTKWTLDEAQAELILDRVVADWPLCGAPAAGTGGGVTTRANGACGGTVTATSEHENGDTTYSVTLDQFCVEGDAGEVVTNGALTVIEDGTPSDTGPVIEGRKGSTNGPVTMAHLGKTVEVEVRGANASFGYPDINPGVPDEDNPNIVTIERASFVHLDDGSREDFVRNVRLERTGGLDGATVRVLSGQGGTESEGFVEIRTPVDDPIRIDALGLTVLGGSLELQGAGDTVLTVTPDTARNGVFTLTLNGEPYSREVDCSDATAPLIQAMFALMVEVPIF